MLFSLISRVIIRRVLRLNILIASLLETTLLPPSRYSILDIDAYSRSFNISPYIIGN